MGIKTYGIWAIICSIVLAPFILLIMNSFKMETQLFTSSPTFFFFPTIQHYETLIQGASFFDYFKNSLFIGCMATLSCLLLGSMLAYALKKMSFKYQRVLLITTLCLRVLPPAVLVVPIFILWSSLQIADTQFGLIIIYIGLNIPFVTWIIYSFLDQFPPSLEDAAKVDGCTHWQFYYTVLIPMIKPGLIAAGIFVFRVCWNEFILALILTNRYTRTLPVQLSLYMSEHNIAWGELMAMGTLIAIPAIVILLGATRYIVTGFSFGGIKS